MTDRNGDTMDKRSRPNDWRRLKLLWWLHGDATGSEGTSALQSFGAPLANTLQLRTSRGPRQDDVDHGARRWADVRLRMYHAAQSKTAERR
jgi:hypothetical protein